LPLQLILRRSTQSGVEGGVDETVWSDSLNLSFVVPDTSGFVQGQHFLHQVRTAVPPGEYELDIVLSPDESAGRPEVRMRRDVVVPSYVFGNLPSVSDITLASSIEPSEDRESPFYKNGLVIRPNANQLYGEGLPRLFYYAETYNADAVSGDDDEYTLLCYVAEANLANPLPDLSRRLRRPLRSPDVIAGSFDIAALPSGSYFLRMVVLNRDNEAIVEQGRKFFVFNPNVVREQPVALEGAFETSPFASMPEADVDREMELIEVISSERERRRARNIRDLDERRRYLMEFWANRDPDPSLQGNTFREDFFQRVQYANDRYTNSFREGWTTDRGRTLLQHGLPSGIDPHLYERDAIPYEVWDYNNIPGEGQVIFVFADRSGFGQFDLIHSTISGGTTLPNWQDELRRR
ncbi:MAG: GWxTD domain-containing protein, partial [Rhodothermales bacterium]|nr:GWxTD domain-containing protein [Rhodothermales bacterium]